MIRDFFRDKPWAQRWMVGAIVLNFLSQFLLYSDPVTTAPIVRTDGYGVLWITLPEGYGRAMGWELHWHAAPILIALALFFANDEFPHGKLFPASAGGAPQCCSWPRACRCRPMRGGSARSGAWCRCWWR